MDVFRLRDEVVDGYADYVHSFLTIADPHIKGYVEDRLAGGAPLAGSTRAAEPRLRAGRHDRRVGCGTRSAPRNVAGFSPAQGDLPRGRPTAAPPAPGGGRPNRPHRRLVRADDRDRVREEPGVLRADRGRRAFQSRVRPRQGHRRLPDERAGKLPDGGTGEVPEGRLFGRARAGNVRALYRPGVPGRTGADRRQPAGYPAHQLRHARVAHDPGRGERPGARPTCASTPSRWRRRR